MIAQIGGMQPGEQINGLVYDGQGPLVRAGPAIISKANATRPLHEVGINRFTWMNPVLVESHALKTDRGTTLALCSLISANERLAEIANELNGHTKTALEALFHTVKRFVDEPGRRVPHLSWVRDVFYAAKHNHRGGEGEVRAYFTPLGRHDARTVLGLVAVCSSKRQERQVMVALKAGTAQRMH